jgi:hypothetical protein
LKFVLHNESFPVENLIPHQVWDALSHDPQNEQYLVESKITPDILRLFVSAVEGEIIELTNKTIEGLSALSGQFQFKSLSQRVEAFKNTPTYRLARLEDRFARLEMQVSALRSTADLKKLQDSTEPLPAAHPSPLLDSVIVSDFPGIFAEFGGQPFSLLWRGSRDGFGANDFHSHCDGHVNTLTVILDTDGNIFGGFTPVEWESPEKSKYKADPSLKSFLFVLKNPDKVQARRFVLKAEKKETAIYCASNRGPSFNDIGVSSDCNTNDSSYTYCFGDTYTNDTGLDKNTFFTGSKRLKVKEIEIFEIIA